MRPLWPTKYRHRANGPEKKGKIETPPPGSCGQGLPGPTRWGSTLPRFNRGSLLASFREKTSLKSQSLGRSSFVRSSCLGRDSQQSMSSIVTENTLYPLQIYAKQAWRDIAAMLTFSSLAGYIGRYFRRALSSTLYRALILVGQPRVLQFSQQQSLSKVKVQLVKPTLGLCSFSYSIPNTIGQQASYVIQSLISFLQQSVTLMPTVVQQVTFLLLAKQLSKTSSANSLLSFFRGNLQALAQLQSRKPFPWALESVRA